MQIEAPISIHDRFDIEIKDIRTNEFVQRAVAYNILLDSFFEYNFTGVWNNYILFGKGMGTLSKSRTSLFNSIGGKASEREAYDIKQAPAISRITKKIVIAANEYVGETFTEVGQGPNNTTPYSHALIKDSEGNDLVLGPKTNVQEITIYATTYFKPDFESGITLQNAILGYEDRFNNSLHRAFLGYGTPYLTAKSSYSRGLNIGNTNYGDFWFSKVASGKLAIPTFRLSTDQANGKIKTVIVGDRAEYYTYPSHLNLNIETLAQNNSDIWAGHQFINKKIGVGDGSTKVFNLPWDEAVLTKPHLVRVDGSEVSGVTWATDKVTFDAAPDIGLDITGNWWVDYIPKDSDHVVDFDFSILLSEGAPS